jgi:hypothetical protein
MVRRAREDPVSAIELLEQHHSGELMGKRQQAERKTVIRPLERQTERSTDDEAQVATRATPLLDETAECNRVELLSVAVEQRHKRSLWEPAGHLAAVADLHQLQADVAGEQLAVMLDVVGERSAQPAHGNDDDPHDEILRATWTTPIDPSVT